MALEYLMARLILAKIDNVGPEAKLLLLRFALVYGDAPLKVTARELARALGIPLNALANATSELDAAGLLIRTPVVDGRGRPSFEYRLAGEQLAKLKEGDESSAGDRLLWPLMECLLRESIAVAGEKTPAASHGTAKRKAVQPSRKGAASKLSNPNRMLLLVLLALADNCGVVRARGAGEIARWVGISGARIHSQVEKLVALGYIRAAVPGVAGRLLFGKVAGTVFLNLQHPTYGERGRPAGIYLFSCPLSAPPRFRLREIPQLVEAAKLLPVRLELSVRMLPNSSLYDPADLYSGGQLQVLAPLLLDGLSSRELIEFLQVKLEEYASCLLSNRWGRLCSASVWEDLKHDEDYNLKARIVREVVPAAVYRGACPGLEVLERYRLLVDLIYYLAVQLADVLKQALMRTKLAPWIRGRYRFEELTYVLLPTTDGGGQFSFTVMTYPEKAPTTSPPGFCVRPGYALNHNPLGLEPRLSEADYSADEKYQHGLLTRAKAQKGPTLTARPASIGWITSI
ncbi:MAG: hypothetical protein ACOY9J_02190 [Pseudomonadota bacterium]